MSKFYSYYTLAIYSIGLATVIFGFGYAIYLKVKDNKKKRDNHLTNK